MELQFLLRSSLKVIKDSTTPKLKVAKGKDIDSLKVIKDSTTPKLHRVMLMVIISLKVIKDSTTPKRCISYF